MSDTFDYLVVGGNVAALVSALELGRKGYRVGILHSGKSWGGHFAGLETPAGFFDAGMNLMEFTSFREQSEDIGSYDPHVRSDVGRFVSVVRRFLEKKMAFTAIKTPKMLWNGKIVDDIVIANCFEAIEKLDMPTKAAIRAELKAAQGRRGPLHASLKSTAPDVFLAASYAQVSKENHGAWLHKTLIEPWVKKISGRSSTEVPALFHRSVWAPLFYPETLDAVLSGGSCGLKETEFHYPKEGNFQAITRALANEMSGIKNIIRLSETIQHIEAKNTVAIQTDKQTLNAKILVWTLDPGRLSKFIGLISPAIQASKPVRVSFGCFELPTDQLLQKFSVLMSVDPNAAFYRITNQTFCAGNEAAVSKIVVETNLDEAEAAGIRNEQELGQKIAALLVESGCLKKAEAAHAVSFVNATWMVPSKNEHDAFEETVASLRRYEKFRLIGASAAYGSLSFNDQVIQGLKVAAEGARAHA